MMCVRRYHESGRQQKCENFESDRPHGEWLTEPHSRIMHCSNCNAEENINKLYSAKWCYSCGADMRVKDELNRVNKELNSEIEKSKSEIVPDYRDGWRKRGEAE